MKKTRLLEIVREEIAFALNEAGLGDQITALEKQKDALEKQKSPLIKKEADLTKKIADLQKKEADAQVKSNATLEEEQNNILVPSNLIRSYIDKTISLSDDMEYTPDMVQALQDLKDGLPNGKMSVENALNIIQQIIDITEDDIDAVESLGQAVDYDDNIINAARDIKGLNEDQLNEMAKITEPIRKGIEVAVSRMTQQKSDITPEQITSLIRNKKTQSQVAPELAAALEADADEKGGDPKYTFGLGYPQTLGAVQIAMGLKKAKGSEPAAEKAPKVAAAPKVKAAMAPKAEPMDDEDKEATKAAGSDETAKELGNISSRKDKVVKAYQELQPQVKDKIDQAKAGDKESANWLKDKWTPILKAYNKAKEVKI
jgi:hypothetical protein